MNQTEQLVFFGVILAYSIFWCVIIYTGIPKAERRKQQKQYDERQISEQGRACKYSYIALVVYLLAYCLLDSGFDIKWCEFSFGVCLGISLSLSVFFAYCVFQDAYFAVGESKPVVLITPNIVALPQLIMGIESATEGNVFKNGIVTADGIHFLFVALVVFLDILVIVRKHMDKKGT